MAKNWFNFVGGYTRRYIQTVVYLLAVLVVIRHLDDTPVTPRAALFESSCVWVTNATQLPTELLALAGTLASEPSAKYVTAKHYNSDLCAACYVDDTSRWVCATNPSYYINTDSSNYTHKVKPGLCRHTKTVTLKTDVTLHGRAVETDTPFVKRERNYVYAARAQLVVDILHGQFACSDWNTGLFPLTTVHLAQEL